MNHERRERCIYIIYMGVITEPVQAARTRKPSSSSEVRSIPNFPLRGRRSWCINPTLAFSIYHGSPQLSCCRVATHFISCQSSKHR